MTPRPPEGGWVPGPWFVAEFPTDSGDYEVHDLFGRTCAVFGELNNPETLATAHLIAAAPALAEALEATLDHYRKTVAELACYYPGECGETQDICAACLAENRLDEIETRARAALAQAKGEK